jgi:glycosyltransferase involved in cell wall biosynthesis
MLYSEFSSELVEFKWTRVFNNPDVFHIHWPETFLSSKSIIKYTVGALGVIAVLLNYRFRGIPIVWSVHNMRPHNSRYFFLNNLFYACLYRLVNHFIVMNEFQMKSLPKNRVSLLRHGMTFKQDIFKSNNHNSNKYFLMFGSISRYKNHIEVINFWKRNVSDYTLKISGWCNDNNYLEELRQAADIASIEINSAFITEDKLNHLIDDSVAVIINYGQNNSGVMYKTIERGTPLLALKSNFSIEIATQFPGLVDTYDSISDLSLNSMKNFKKEKVYNENYDWRNISVRCEEILSDVVSTR